MRTSAQYSEGTLSNMGTGEVLIDHRRPGPTWDKSVEDGQYEFECDAEAADGTIVSVAIYDTDNDSELLASGSKAAANGAAQVKVFFTVAGGFISSSHHLNEINVKGAEAVFKLKARPARKPRKKKAKRKKRPLRKNEQKA